jgi:hypothetical protein
MSDIASLNTVSNSLDAISKLVRILEKDGVSFDELMRPINDKTARRNLVSYLKAGCRVLSTPPEMPASQTQVSFERNEHGHVVVTITGLDLTGKQEVERLEAAGYRVSDYAKSCFRSTAKDGYDKNHRLVAGQLYKFALVPGKEIQKDSDRTTANIRKLGEKYAYGKPLGGAIPRIREAVSDKQMEEMEIWYIASPHDPVTGSGGSPIVLRSHRDGGGPWVSACWDDPDGRWGEGGAFAFPVPASKA